MKDELTAIAAIMTAAMTLNTGCDDLFDPAIENHKGASALEELPAGCRYAWTCLC